MNKLGVSKNLKESKFGMVCDKLKTKKMFSETMIDIILETNSNFHMK